MKKKCIIYTIFVLLMFSGCNNSNDSTTENMADVPKITVAPNDIDHDQNSFENNSTSEATIPPTEQPTLHPTEAPTVKPTPASTLTPTAVPVVVATDAPAHVPDVTPAPTVLPSDNTAQIPDSDNWYQQMISTSILSTGTNGRLEKFIEKIKRDEPVSIVAYGGSITEGAGAENFTYSYGDHFVNTLFQTYPLTSGNYYNSGLGGTPSTLGLMRYKRDVTDILGASPDLVIIEFAVNDYNEPTKGRAYESLVRSILEENENTAVILLFSVFESKWNMQDTYIPIGEHYGLPMVSIKDAIAIAYAGGHLTDKEYFADIYHPTNYGHDIMADCLMELFTLTAMKDASQPIAPVPETDVYGADFAGMQLITSQNPSGTTVTTGSFTSTDTALQTFSRTAKGAFPDNWHHKSDGGNESLKIELTCKNILLSYKFSSSQNFGKASVYIDGQFITELNGYLNGGWNNTETVLIFDQDVSAPHVLEIKMSEGQENKSFTILGIGYTP